MALRPRQGYRQRPPSGHNPAGMCRVPGEKAKSILPLLTEEEAAVFKRGRNAQVHTVPSHASRAQYREATALEALFGWLYLSGQRERVNELFSRMMEEHN